MSAFLERPLVLAGLATTASLLFSTTRYYPMLLKLGANSLKSIASVLEKRANKIQKNKLILPVKARVTKSHRAKDPAAVATPGPTPPAKLVRSSTVAQLAAADPAKWAFKSCSFKGAARFIKKGKEELIQGEIEEGLRTFEQNPAKYYAIKYQTNMVSFPKDQQKYWLLHRAGTKGYQPADVGPDGWMTFKTAEYQRLKPLPAERFSSAKDDFTDDMQFAGYRLHHEKNPAISPGRGMGVGDVPSLKIIGDVDPSDVNQGGVGDCWLLSAISALAEFDGAIERLFRKTPNLASMPRDEPNTYTITLWDLPTWTEVDVVIDERLAAKPDGTGLLGCSPSSDGELWACYLEKAIAKHCGGWDQIDGGSCTHAWAILTGCRYQYNIRRKEDGKFYCFGKYNPNDKKWETLQNCPHEGFTALWPMDWPEVGGGGSLRLGLDEEELWMRMCEWDAHDFVVAAGTRAGSDRNKTDGLVDGHAYTVIDCHNDVANTDIDLVKIRNPWGSGEIDDGKWDDDGPGWEEYPQIKEYLKPVAADDGIFYLSKQEFFKYFGTIYLCAESMTKFNTDAPQPTGA